MSWIETVQRTVSGMKYELVETERSAGGLLRVFIDRLPGESYLTGPGDFILVEDCERVTRQLQHVLEVENVDYHRLEVSSPGLDRPLRTAEHYARFVGQQVVLTLKLPFQGRKKFQGLLQAAEDGQGWQLVFNDGKADQVLGFALDEVREARLVPVLDFKGRRGKAAPSDAAASEAPHADGGQEE